MKIIGTILVVLGIIVPAVLFGGLVWMLALGALSHIFNVPNLAIGYWQSVLVSLIFALLFGAIGSSKD